MKMILRMLRLAALVVVLTLVIGPFSGEAASKKVTWNFHTLFGKGSSMLEEWHVRAIDEIKKSTGGDLELVIFERSSLGFAGPDIWDVVRKGLLPIAEMFGGAVAGRYPWIVAFELPYMYDLTNVELTDYLTDSIWDYFAKPLAKDNLVLISLFMQPAGRCFLVNKNPNPDPKTTFKGMKIRVSGPASTWGVETLGGTPVMLDYAEVYEAGMRGIVDGIDVIIGSPVFSSKFNEAFKKVVLTDKKNSTLLQYSSTTGMVVANKEKFESLPVEWQKIVKESWKKATRSLKREVLRDGRESLRAAGEKYGMSYVEVPQGTETYLKNQAPAFWQKWREKAGPYGSEVMDEGLKLIKAFK